MHSPYHLPLTQRGFQIDTNEIAPQIEWNSLKPRLINEIIDWNPSKGIRARIIICYQCMEFIFNSSDTRCGVKSRIGGIENDWIIRNCIEWIHLIQGSAKEFDHKNFTFKVYGPDFACCRPLTSLDISIRQDLLPTIPTPPVLAETQMEPSIGDDVIVHE